MKGNPLWKRGYLHFSPTLVSDQVNVISLGAAKCHGSSAGKLCDNGGKVLVEASEMEADDSEPFFEAENLGGLRWRASLLGRRYESC